MLGGFVGFVFLLFWIPFQAAAGNKVAEWIARVSVVVFVIGVVGAISGFVYLAATQESDGDPGPSEAESRIAQEWEIIEGQFERDPIVVPVAMRVFGCSGRPTVGRTRLA